MRFFLKGVHPSREDPQNANGGKWIVQFYSNTNVDKVWLNLILDLIGNKVMSRWGVSGVELNIRDRGDRISVWTNNCELNIQKELGEYLTTEGGQSVVALSFKRHEDIIKKKSAFIAKSLLKLK